MRAIRAADADSDVVLRMGAPAARLRKLIFIDVRDRGGIAQDRLQQGGGAEAHARAEELRGDS